MGLLFAHPWAPFTSGMLVGCWVGAAIGCAITMLLAGRRLRQLQSANLLLRAKLRAREKTKARGATPVLVMPPIDSRRAESASAGRVASSR